MKWILILIMAYFINPVTPEQKQAIEDTHPDLLCWGIGGTCKTHTGADKAILVGSIYPKNRILLIRKRKIDLRETLWKKFCELVPDELLARPINSTTMTAILKNGTEIIGCGLESEREVNKLASMEAGMAIVEEATEIPERYYDEKIRRAVRLPRVPFHQVMLLCNPGPPTHWIKKRWIDEIREGYKEIFFQTLSPFLDEGWLKWFKSLTGIFAARYREGKWVGAEGLVYPFDPKVHQINPIKIPEDWEKVVALDFGFPLMHPFCCQWWAISSKKYLSFLPGSWFCYRQIYITGRTVSELAPQIKQFMEDDGILNQKIICDHDAEDRGTLRLKGLKTKPANKQRLAGQRSVHDLIAHKPKPKLFFFKNSLVEEDLELRMHKLPVCTEDEFGLYTWANKDKEDMIKKYDHGMDTMRYAVHTTSKRSKDLEYRPYA